MVYGPSHSNSLNSWFTLCLNYNSLRERVLSNRVATDDPHIITFIQENQIIHQAAEKQDMEFVRALVELGVDGNCPNSNGDSVLDILGNQETVEPGNYLWLVDKGMRPINTSIIDAVDNPKLISIRESLINYLTIEDLLKGNIYHVNSMYNLNNHSKDIIFQTLINDLKNHKINEKVIELVVFLDEARFLQWILNQSKTGSSFLQWILNSSQTGLSNEKIDQIVRNKEFLRGAHENQKFFYELSQFFVHTTPYFTDLRKSLLFEQLIKSRSNAEFVCNLDVYVKVYPEPFTTEVISYLMQTLNHLPSEREPIWMSVSTFNLPLAFAFQQLNLFSRLDQQNRTALFFDKWIELDTDQIASLGIDLQQVDINGDNALEFFCKKPNIAINSDIYIRKYVSLGLRINSSFPNFEILQRNFPNEFFLQAFVAQFFLRLNKKLSFEFQVLLPKELQIFEKALKSDPILQRKLGKYFESFKTSNKSKTTTNSQPTLLFYDNFIGRKVLNLTGMKINIFEVNNQGENALEFHSKKTEPPLDYIRHLSLMGLCLGSNFPNFKLCQRSFPSNPFLQTVLGIFLIRERKKGYRSLMQQLTLDEVRELNKAIALDPELKQELGRYILPRSAKEVYPDLNIEKLYPSDRYKVDQIVLSYNHLLYINDLLSFWPEFVPSEVFELVPESPLLSLLIGAIHQQHKNKSPEVKSFPIERLFVSSLLTHDDMVLFNRYVFEHPETMTCLGEDYMFLKRLYIMFQGGSDSKYSKVISLLIKCTKEITHVSNVKDWQQRIVGSFNTPVTPVILDGFELPSSSMEGIGRTGVFHTSGEASLAVKIKKPSENYLKFAQEQSVTTEFRQNQSEFQSTFHEPVGVYYLKTVPQRLQEFAASYGISKVNVLYVYRADKKIFSYLQNSDHSTFIHSRSKCLTDATKMVTMGIHPDIISLFHNEGQGRRYAPLRDVALDLLKPTPSKGGMGRIDIAFEKSRYPNARETGITDMRDASLLTEPSEEVDLEFLNGSQDDGVVFFRQMNALASIMVADMLMLVEHLKKEDRITWNNIAHIDDLAQLLAEGFAQVFSNYSGQSFEKSLLFLNHCVNWKRAASQIAFWTDTTPNGYPSWIAREKLPENLYPPEAKIYVYPHQSPNFDPIKGCFTDGKQDIGLYNGPACLEEFSRALHFFFNAVLLKEQIFNLD